MSAGHITHVKAGAVDPARTRDLEKLLANRQFAAAVAAYDREDDTHDVPYVGGSLTDWRTVVWDRHFVQALKEGRFRLQGKPVDPRRTGKVHEAVEAAIIHLWPLVMQLLGWPDSKLKYPRAHDVADVAERHAVEHLGWQWGEYQDQWRPFIKLEGHEQIVNPPHNLLLEAYRGTKLYAKLATFQLGSQQAHRRIAARIGAQLAPDGNHYLPDASRPGKYLKLVHQRGGVAL